MEYSQPPRPLHPPHSPIVHQHHQRPPAPRRTVTLEDEPEVITRGRSRERERIYTPENGTRYWNPRPDWDGYTHGMGVATIPRRYSRYESPERHANGRSRSGSLERLIIDRDQYHDLVSNQSTTHFVKPHNAQDMTIHMSLPVQDDVEDLLEECARLRRLGHFRDAIQLFEDELSHFVDNRYVLFQYGLCLIQAGEYIRLAKLASDTSSRQIRDDDLLDVAFRLLLCEAEIGYIDDATFSSIGTVAEDLVRRSWPTIDSTEARVLACPWIIQKAFAFYDGLPDWHVMYRHLVDRGMIWEFRDIFQALTQDLSVDRALSKLTGRHVHAPGPGTPDPLDRLRQQWDTDSDDESTWFALLDIFTNMALMYKEYLDLNRDEKSAKCMDIASEYARKLVSKDDSNSLSQPYLRWTVAKVLVKETNRNRIEDSVLFRGRERGSLKVPRFAFPAQLLPVYIPAMDETPEWKPTPAADRSGAAVIRTVFEAAEELGDLEMQTACLRELLYRGDEPPDKMVKKLNSLWQSSGNMHMIRILQLFRYMLAHTPAARERLRRDILDQGEIWRYPFLQAAQKAILGALSTDEGQKKYYRYQAWSINSRDESRMPRHYSPGPDFSHPPPPPPPSQPSSPPMGNMGAGPVVTVGRTRHPRARSESPRRDYGRYTIQEHGPHVRSPQPIARDRMRELGREPTSPLQPRKEPKPANKPPSNVSSHRTLKNIIQDVKRAEAELQEARALEQRERVRYLKGVLETLNAEEDAELDRLREEVADARGLGEPRSPSFTSFDRRPGPGNGDEDIDDRASQRTARVEDYPAEGNSEVNIVTVKSPEPINLTQRGPYLLGFPGYGGVTESGDEEPEEPEEEERPRRNSASLD